MPRYNCLLCFALLLCLTGYGASYRPAYAQTVVAAAPTCPEDAKLQASQESDIVTAVNNARIAANLNPVQINKLLDVAAQRQSDDMAAKDFLDHTGSDGSDVGARVTATGYAWGNLGENILFRMDMSAAGAYDQWWNSPGHKANMMNPAFTEIGVTFSCTVPTAKYYYAMVLAAPLGGAPAANGSNATSGDNSSQPTAAATSDMAAGDAATPAQ